MILDGAALRILKGPGVRPEILGFVTDGDAVGSAAGEAARGLGISKRAALDLIGAAIASGHLDVEFVPGSDDLRTVISGGSASANLCRTKPHLWNVLAYEREWETHPEYNDFLDIESPVYWKKKFQMEIYENLLRPEIWRLGWGARVLDVGGGVGRAALSLMRRGCAVTVTDASPRALKCAWRRLAESGFGEYDFAWAEAENLDIIPDRSMDAALALEVFCYIRDPARALAETVRKVKPGGWVAVSVENKIGAMLSDPYLEGLQNKLLIKDNVLAVENELYVRYLNSGELRGMARAAGLESVRIEKCHYIADGVFEGLAGPFEYAGSELRSRLHDFEKIAGWFPFTRSLARARMLVGTVR
ncbi:MAG TPA: class I SAM-dependent methyltransferase [bacterium]|nr:class I SAM-dependent methyltransferase [bacterium]